MKTSFRDRLLVPYNGLKLNWFDMWQPALDEALHSLPELDACPHKLFRLLIQNPGPARKRIAMLTEQGVPVAVVGLRQKGHFSWEPVMQWIIPGEPFPSKPGYMTRALEALNAEIWVAWWRAKNPPPSSQLTRYIEATPTYGMHCDENIEQYWRDNGYFKTIRRVRNRCMEFTAKINATGSAEWTIKNWEEKWRSNPASMDPSLSDRILAANYLENSGQYYTISLYDQGVQIGGATATVHKRDLVAGVLYSDPQYRKSGVGDRLIDLSFSLAMEKGFETFDIGGGHEYKKHWARENGRRWWFHVCPEPLFQMRQALKHIRGLRGNGTGESGRELRVE